VFLTHWSIGLWAELRGSGVDVVTICPGLTDTEFFENSGIEPHPKRSGYMSVQKVGRLIRQAVDRNQALMICGISNRLLASICGILPKTWITRLAQLAIRAHHLKTK